MISSKATSVSQYLKELPADRRKVVSAVRDHVRKNLPKGYEEGMQYGMIAWSIPLSVFPDTYNGQALSVCALASQKQNISLYLLGPYGSPALAKWFTREWKKTGKKLDMGKSCLRFRTLDDLALDVLAKALQRVAPEDLMQMHDSAHGKKKKKATTKKKTKKKKKKKR
jgi:hypothetical protein